MRSSSSGDALRRGRILRTDNQREVDRGVGQEGRGVRQAVEEDERAELRRLRKENSELRMEREILKERRPISPRKIDAVRVHRFGEGRVSPATAVSDASSLQERLLRVAAVRSIGSSPRG